MGSSRKVVVEEEEAAVVEGEGEGGVVRKISKESRCLPLTQRLHHAPVQILIYQELQSGNSTMDGQNNKKT
jgi:hypothetical protein